VIIAAVFTGLVPFDVLVKIPANDRAEPLTMALAYVAPWAIWATAVLAFGSVVAQTAVLLVFQMGQPRIFFSMARDGLLPPIFARVHPRFQTPHVTTILTGIVVGGFSAVGNIDEMVDLTNIGTLFAFVLVCLGIPILRFTDRDRPRAFRVPLGDWFLPLLGAASCVGLMYYLPPSSWWRFVGWLVLGLSIYSSYGYSRSAVGRAAGRPHQTPVPLMFAAFGFFATACGLFTIPHDAGLRKLFQIAAEATHDHHTRTLIGLGLIATGAIFALVGTFLGASHRADKSADGTQPDLI
jgi:APA family basic amino acid/polyamine antiporter